MKKNNSANTKVASTEASVKSELNKYFIAAAAAPEELDLETKKFALHVTFENKEEREYAFEHFNDYTHNLKTFGFDCDTAMREGDLEITCWCTLYGEAFNSLYEQYESIDDQLNCTEWATEAIHDLRVDISDAVDYLESKGKFSGVYLHNLHKIVDTLLANAELHIDREEEELKNAAKSDFYNAGAYLRRLAFAILDYCYERGV